ncbi:MAG TPA: hypothetical protein VHB79_07205 [Polyangiaceae bacterium]|nr:hypothetical protein [Polyangiaceae bacterium]
MRSRPGSRFLLFVTPLSAVGVVLLGVVSGGVRPLRSARVYSGPTQGQTELSFRVELSERNRAVEAPLSATPFSLVAVEGGQRVASAAGRTDEQGSAEIELQLPRPRDSAFELRVEPPGTVEAPLARGLVLGRKEIFQAAATRRGGFQSGRHSGDIELSVAPARGVLVTAQGPLQDELVLRARRGGSGVVGARLRIKLEGAEPAQAELETDASGLSHLPLRPSDAQVRVAVDASADGIGEGTLAACLEVVQGAIRVRRDGNERQEPGRLLVESSGAASRAFLGFFDENRRYGGASVPLTLAPDGRLVGELPWPAGLTASPLWVVASSQPDLASPSAVGWPVVTAGEPDPRTFDARELLLLDGAPSAQLREERRARRIRWVTAAYATLSLLLTLVMFVRRVRESDAAIAQHLAESGVDDAALSIAPQRKGRAVLAAACIGLGFVVLAVFALLKE